MRFPRFFTGLLLLALSALLATPSWATPAREKSEARRAEKAGASTQAASASSASAQRRAPAAASVASAERPAPRAATNRTTRVAATAAAAGGVVSFGHATGLHRVDDPLDLHSAVALVVDQETGETLFSKNPEAVLPIASITKLMTAQVVLDAAQPLDEILEITTADIDTQKGSSSRLRPGTRLSRGEMLQLALMASENRAAHALGRHYPGGLDSFVLAMNARAEALGMRDSRFVDPTGLSSRNVSNAHDLTRLMRGGFEFPLVRQFSTASGLTVEAGRRPLAYHNTNRLIANPTWEIGLQKTGYISEAGSCLVMQAMVSGRGVLMVLLDAVGRRSRFGDAQRLKQWMEAEHRRRGSQQIGRLAVRSAG